ncbi:MAG TPA: LacI family DNA-binding transcriptional regulator [Anaerolineales bacterium]|nr:LacI family DNA-binding transcriptional regulator [Anaerolineales bacterium]
MNKKNAKTLDDIARLAKVSKSTVSRALNNSPLLNQQTKERIQTLARKHNFRVNVSARNLRIRQSHTIAFVTPDCEPNFFSPESLFGFEILGGIGNELHSLGYDLLIANVNPMDTTPLNSYIGSGRADGYILLSSKNSQAIIDKMIELDAPFITWGLPLPNFNYCSVDGDNITGGTLATNHLIQNGRQHIAFLGGPPEELTVQHRYQGYENAFQANGQRVAAKRVVYGDYSYTSGLDAMQRLLKQSPDLDAVFVNSDLMAIAAIKVILESGRRVPEDIAVVGYDDVSIAMYNNLPLTTIRQNVPMAGSLLAQNLIRHIKTGEITNVTTPVELVIRKSA